MAIHVTKQWIFCLYMVCIVYHARAQFIYKEIGIADHSICHYDTVLFNPRQQYNAYGYMGDAPLFVQVWYPCAIDSGSVPLTYGQLGGKTIPHRLDSVWQELNQKEQTTSIAYHISESLPEYEEADYGSFSYAMVFDSMLVLPTRSYYRIPHEPLSHPILVYHHGSQGLAKENHVLAEYFASQGWVVVSAAFHLPFPGLAYGLTDLPFDQESFAHRVLDYARELNPEGFVAFAGHSWGAQMGWRILWEEGLADAFVSLETTIEFKEDMEVIKDYWPESYRVLEDEDKKIDAPVLTIANTGLDTPFPFFEGKGKGLQVHASAKEPFTHESYTSAMLWRSNLGEHIEFSDREFLEEQVRLYQRHLELIAAFLQSVREGNAFDPVPFERDFFLHTRED